MRLLFVPFLIIIFLFLLLSLPVKAFGAEHISFIAIVNPVRISSYTKDPATSLKKEYEEIAKRNLPATWLLTYDAITNRSIFEVVSPMDDKQEFGIFLEVTGNFSNASGVSY